MERVPSDLDIRIPVCACDRVINGAEKFLRHAPPNAGCQALGLGCSGKLENAGLARFDRCFVVQRVSRETFRTTAGTGGIVEPKEQLAVTRLKSFLLVLA